MSKPHSFSLMSSPQSSTGDSDRLHGCGDLALGISSFTFMSRFEVLLLEALLLEAAFLEPDFVPIYAGKLGTVTGRERGRKNMQGAGKKDN